MCRNIKRLFNFEPPATRDEVRSAAEQYVRKISGFTKPSQANREAFEKAVKEVTDSTVTLLNSMRTNSPPHDRAAMAERAHAQAIRRFGN